MERSRAEQNVTERNGAEWNIDLTPLFDYFIQNVSFHLIHPKLDEQKIEIWMKLDGMDPIMFHSISSIICKSKQWNLISYHFTPFHYISYHQFKQQNLISYHSTPFHSISLVNFFSFSLPLTQLLLLLLHLSLFIILDNYIENSYFKFFLIFFTLLKFKYSPTFLTILNYYLNILIKFYCKDFFLII